jgi:glutamine synthetase
VVAPEMEFFLVARNLDPAKPIEPMMGRSGRPPPRGRPIR